MRYIAGKSDNSIFRVNVIGSMCTGKSTLVNALLHKKLLPCHAACTATITEILDNEAPGFKAVAYGADNKVIKEVSDLTLEVMKELNDDEEVHRISVEGDFPFLDGNSMALIPEPLHLNSVQNQVRNNIIYRAINSDSNDLVLFVLDATRWGIGAETSLLYYVADQIKKGGKQVRDRFLFVINKMDTYNPEDESVQEVVDSAKSYLNSFGIDDPQIFLCSAFTALNLRTSLKDVDVDNLTRGQQSQLSFDALATIPNIDKLVEYESMHLETYSTLSPSVQRELNYRLSRAVANQDAKEQALIHSGICSIEAAITAYVKKYAKTVENNSHTLRFQNESEDLLKDCGFGYTGAKIKHLSNGGNIMVHVYVKYNPYRLETTLMVDGRDIPTDSGVYDVKGKRLQEWIEKFPERLCNEYNTADFSLEFCGMELDFDDFKDAFEQAERNGIVKVSNMKHIAGKSDDDVTEKIVTLFNELQAGPIDDFRDPKLLRAFKSADNSIFPVTVIATMSTGKSTLINALLHKKLLPSKNAACTATITEILDNDDPGFKAVAYDADNKVIKEVPELTLEVMKELNDDEEVHRISVEGDIPFIDSNGMALMLIDTPGPNSAQNQGHKNTTYRTINNDSNSLILYVLNATQQGIQDDADLLRYVSEQIKKGGKQVRDRFLFVINKMDTYNPEDESVQKAVDSTKSYLNSFGIDDPQIFLCSAFTALNLRTSLKDVDVDNLTRGQQKQLSSDARDTIPNIDKLVEYESMHLETYSMLPPSVQRELTYRLNRAVANQDTKEQALIHSGICSIEAVITAYVKKYAKTKKVKDLVETFYETLESNEVLTKAKTRVATDAAAAKACKARAAAIRERIDSGEEAKVFQQKIEALDPIPTINEKVEQLKQDASTETSVIFKNYGETITSPEEAKRLIMIFSAYGSNAMAKLASELESIINSEIVNIGERMLMEYQDKISKIDESFSDEQLDFQTIDLVKGALKTMRENTESWTSDDFATETVENIGETSYEERTYYEKVGQKEEEVLVGTHKEKIGTKRVIVGAHEVSDGYWKPNPKYMNATIFTQWARKPAIWVDCKKIVNDYRDEDVFETVKDYETVIRDVFEEKTETIEKFSVSVSAIQKALVSKMRLTLDEGTGSALEFASEQVKRMKEQFYAIFAELDKLIESKYDELERCATDQAEKEAMLAANQKLLAWIEEKIAEVNSILDM